MTFYGRRTNKSTATTTIENGSNRWRARRDHAVRIAGKQATAFASLAATVLPDLSDATAVDALASRLGLHEIKTLHTRLMDQLAKNAFRRKEIEGSEQYSDRDLHLLRLETKRNELEPLYRHAHLEWQKLQAQEKLAELMARGYGTDQYAHRGWLRFFNKQHLDDWRCADAATEALGFASFEELRVAYKDRSEQMQVLGRDWNELNEQKAAIEQLEQERERLIREETELPQETYQEMGERIAAILDNGKSPQIDSLPNPDALRSRLNEISGMNAQTEYLDGLRTQVERETASIAERAEKLYQERNRYAGDRHRYRNKRFSDEQWGKRFGDHRTARYEPLYNRYRRTSDTVYVFHDYNRASGLEDFLWWDVMTDGRMDGNFLPEVREWRDHNPDYRYERYSSRSSDSSSSSSTDAFESDNFGGNDPS
jgi:phage terminase Nu1 subunit (DNA packaging protein)